MFQNLMNISVRYIDLSSIGLSRIESILPRHLETLKLSDNPEFHHKSLQLFYLHNIPNLKHLYVQNISLTSSWLANLESKMINTHLKTLMLDRNIITEIYTAIHHSMPYLETVSATGNQLSSMTNLIAKLLKLRHLKYLNLSHQNDIISYPQNKHKVSRRHRRHINLSEPVKRLCSTNRQQACPFGLPRNLSHLDLSYSAFHLPRIPELALSNNNSLQFVSLASNAIQLLPKPFYCPYNTKPVFTILDLSNNEIGCINSSYFIHCDWSSLNILYLRQNQLKQNNGSECDTGNAYFLSFLKPLWNLTKLDLSGNMFENNLKFTTFATQRNLQELHLSNMRMSSFNIQISHMTKLQTLDISSNNLKCLSRDTMAELHNLSSSQSRLNNGKTILHVDIHNNPLQCSCECYSFLKWFQSTNVIFPNMETLSCILGGTKFSLSDINDILITLDNICFPQTWIHIMFGVECAICFVITVFSLLRRHRYRIYFLYIKLRILLVSKVVTNDIRPFHAFISHAEQDRPWVKKKLIKNLEKKKKLKLLVASRDFEPGKLIAANILSAIKRSNKTVFVISRSFLKSSWCLEEFSMALSVSKAKC